jgi:N-acetylglucosaminylphosphatidylinositol deacetylase
MKDLHVLVIAHPDDESMFFLPFLLYHLSQRQKEIETTTTIWILCLTTGNYDGLGPIRTGELYRTAREYLGVDKIIQIDDANILDHPTQKWSIPYVAKILHESIASTMSKNHSDSYSNVQIVTFDEYGVSGHINHIDTHAACRFLFENTNEQTHPKLHDNMSLWVLESIRNPILKYLPIWDWFQIFLSFLFAVLGFSDRSSGCPCFTTSRTSVSERMQQQQPEEEFRIFRPWVNWRAMQSHYSQFVWYRKLSVLASRYTYWNRYQRIDPVTHTNFNNSERDRSNAKKQT